MMAGGLHVHDLNMTGGTLTATLGDATGRHLCIEIRPEDNPAVDEALNRLDETIVAAATSVMLDLVGMAPTAPVVPDDVSALEATIPCRICGTLVTIPDFSEDQRPYLLRTTRCVQCTAVG